MFWMKLYYSVLLGLLPGILAGGIAACMGWRIPRGITGWGRSMCPSCEKTLPLMDAFPLFGYLRLRGRCRFCGVKISPFYSFVELAGGIASVALFYVWGPSWGYLLGMVFMTCCLIAAVSDVSQGVIPDKLNIFIALIGVAVLIFRHSLTELFLSVGGAGTAYFTFLISSLITRKHSGGGDVKFLTAAGLLLGPLGVCFSMMLSVICAVSLEPILWRRGFGQPFAFGPYLALGGIMGYIMLPTLLKF